MQTCVMKREMDGHVDLQAPLPADVRVPCIRTCTASIKMIYGVTSSRASGRAVGRRYGSIIVALDSVDTAIDSQSETAEARS